MDTRSPHLCSGLTTEALPLPTCSDCRTQGNWLEETEGHGESPGAPSPLPFALSVQPGHLGSFLFTGS